MGVPGVGSSLQAKMPGQKSIGNLKVSTVSLELSIEAKLLVYVSTQGKKKGEKV